MQNPWDVRPKQENGDTDFAGIFLQVGRALTNWEALESDAAELFDALVAAQPSNRAAFMAYSAVKAASARTELLDAAYRRALTKDDPAYQPVAALVEAIGKFGARRNEIAHGRVFNLGEHGYMLGPNNIMSHKWTTDGAAKYQWCADDIEYYAEQFESLVLQARALTFALVERNIAASRTRETRSRKTKDGKRT